MKLNKEDRFNELVTNHTDQIQRICFGFKNNLSDVNDLYQEVLLNIWKGMEGFRHESAVTTWIHRITINTCLLWEKRNKRFQSAKELKLYSEIEVMNVTNKENPELIRLRNAINKLKPSDKSLILLLLEELSYKEIQEITGLSISNIGVKINRIKSRIKKEMIK